MGAHHRRGLRGIPQGGLDASDDGRHREGVGRLPLTIANGKGMDMIRVHIRSSISNQLPQSCPPRPAASGTLPPPQRKDLRGLLLARSWSSSWRWISPQLWRNTVATYSMAKQGLNGRAAS